MTTRRDFVFFAVTGALAFPLVSLAQQAGKIWRIGFFYWGSRQSATNTGRYRLFLQGMSELGYVEGRNLIVEARFADGVDQRLSALATELVQSKVDVIVTTGGPVNLAARAATKTIPIVMTVSSNPVGQGLAASLARPGGNITGMSTVNNEIGPKQVELLLETLRKVALIAVLENPNNPALRPTANNIQAAAQRRGKQVRVVPAGTPEQIERGFAAMSSSHADALIVLSDTFFLQQASQISTLALEHRLPSMFVNPEYALAGGLMSYGSDITGNFRRIATYVDKILKGAKPGDLPIEQPTQFELVINMKTAKGLGITIPQRVLLRADRVIE